MVVVVDVEVVVVVVGGGPVDTAMSTALPGGTLAPVPGLDDTTTGPARYCVDDTERDVPHARGPALARVCPATAWDRPTSDGTMALAGPDETVRVTAEPWLTLVPDVGLVLSTVPFWAELVLLTMVAVRPALCRMAVALAWVVLVRPSGTVTWTGGATMATFSVTVSPFLTRLSGVGLVEMTVPGASLETCWTWVTLRPSDRRVAVATGGLLADHDRQVERRRATEVAEVAGEEVAGDEQDHDQDRRG